MNRYTCACGNAVYLDNTRCLKCERDVGFYLDDGELQLICSDAPRWRGVDLVPCANRERGLCNWFVARQDAEAGKKWCASCRLSRVIPDLSVDGNLLKLAEVESSKRRLVANLARLGLSVCSKEEAPETGLAFDILSSLNGEKVITGHSSGVITLNLDEADPVQREKQRCKLGEAYRTILGHLRHEIGHYFFDRLIADQGRQPEFRRLFGDERADYAEALKRHYEDGPAADWVGNYVSPYASSHPWEDWAETWAHYLHAVAATETARHYGLPANDPDVDRRTDAFLRGSLDRRDFEGFLTYWDLAAVTINELNRSLGAQEAYPFQWAPPVVDKLFFVHQAIRTRETLAKVA